MSCSDRNSACTPARLSSGLSHAQGVTSPPGPKARTHPCALAPTTSASKASAVRPWIGTLARRLCLDKLRGGGREQPIEEEEEFIEDGDAFAELDEALAVRQAMQDLPEHCAEILDRFFAKDESYKTIGEALDIPAGTIASRISRCLSKMKSKLEGRKPRFQPSGSR